MQLEFWTQFKAFASSRQTGLPLRKARPQHWYDLSIGSSKAHLTLIVDTQSEQIRCELYIPDCQDLYEALVLDKEEIERQLQYELTWMELPGKKASRILTIKSIDVNDSDTWDNCFAWLLEASQVFQSVFSTHIRKLGL